MGKKRQKKQKALISNKYEDKKERDRVKKQGDEGKFGNNVRMNHERKDVRQGGKKAVKKYLNEEVKKADAVVVLVGNDTHNAQGVNYEVNNAKAAGKPVINVRIGGTKGAPPKQTRNQGTISNDPNSIKKALNTESKKRSSNSSRGRTKNSNQKKK